MMPEKKPEAALLGLPGRTQIVGSRMPIPSKTPSSDVKLLSITLRLRPRSFSGSSHASKIVRAAALLAMYHP